MTKNNPNPNYAIIGEQDDFSDNFQSISTNGIWKIYQNTYDEE